MKLSSETHVCVIGAGVCGLVSVKSCLEAGFNVTCFEKSPTFGGLWCYRDEMRHPGDEFIPSVMRTTILNTSKELSSFSDFPPPSEAPNFMRHDRYMDYIRSYVEHFKLLPHLKLRHEIMNFEPEYNKETRQIKWLVGIRDMKTNRVFEGKFDRVMVAVGHHNIPYCPNFPNQHKFRGQILHSAHLKDILTDVRVQGKRVVVIGFGNSACDAANDLAIVASRCYLSSHRGNWFIGRLMPSGLYDFEDKKRWNYYRAKFVPNCLVDRIKIQRVKEHLNHELLGFTPKHKPSEQVPMINDLFPFRVFTGGITLKGSLLRFTEKGVVFDGEEETECEADIVILATGYQARLPFVNETELGLRSAESNEYELYLNMFAPKLKIVGLPGGMSADSSSSLNEAIKSLAFIGLVQPAGSITVVSELQARLAALVFGDKRDLPSVSEMLKHNESARAQRSIVVRSHSRDQILGNWIKYCDEIAGRIGAKPNMTQLFFKDLVLWKQLMFGPSVSYQYRLQGPGSWCKARETILTTNDRVYQGINEGKNHILFQRRRKRLIEPAGKNASNKK